MPRYAPAAPDRHDAPQNTGIVLINLGTPDAPTASAVRRYLKEFLSDPRVVEIPRLLWWPILNGIILNTRPAKSAAKYASIWRPDGSPLKVYTERQCLRLRETLAARGHRVLVDYAMRYGSPSIPDVLDRLKAEGCTRLLLLPLYPQYSSSTTATAFDAATDWLSRQRKQPEWRTLRAFADDPGYIEALAASVRQHWQEHPRPAAGYRLLASFHGVPRRTRDLGDPYHQECLKTARLLAEALDLPAETIVVAFQSRFGRAEWLQPYTAPTLIELGKQKLARIDVLCPGFAADCLETLEEIALEGKADFLAAGGGEYHYIPALNDRPEWIDALADLAERHLQGWPTAPLAESGRHAKHAST